MTLALDDKKRIVEDTRASAEAAVAAIIADYRGMDVGQMTDLRKQARESGVKLQVVRNTLARLAFEGTMHECLRDSFKGPTLVAYSEEDPGAGARLLRSLQNTGIQLDVRAISVAGTLRSGEDLSKVASLPTREQALAKLMAVMIGPVAKLAQVMQAVPTKFVRTLVAVKEQKQSESGSETAGE